MEIGGRLEVALFVPIDAISLGLYGRLGTLRALGDGAASAGEVGRADDHQLRFPACADRQHGGYRCRRQAAAYKQSEAVPAANTRGSD